MLELREVYKKELFSLPTSTQQVNRAQVTVKTRKTSSRAAYAHNWFPSGGINSLNTNEKERFQLSKTHEITII